MTLRSTRYGQAALVVLLAAFLWTPNSFAQYQQGTPPPTSGSQSGAASQAQQQTQKETQPAAAAAVPKADPEEEAAYKAFSDTKPEDADKTLALNPDDVTVLVLVGWVIPHNFDPNDLAAESRLDKGEKYEKHALEVLATLPKPANMTDEQFAKVKAQGESQAHSGLGLIYFRRQDYEQSIAELKKSTADPANQDATDYYVMGVELTRLKRFSESADAFQKCSTMPGGLQDRCKQMGSDAKKQAAATPAPTK
jgi:tetratricopeptide (TPR) repeat protein